MMSELTLEKDLVKMSMSMFLERLKALNAFKEDDEILKDVK
jgi:hypothetical protein